MRDRIGIGRYILPLVLVALVACIMGVLFYPMANMQMKNLPFAIVSLDEGATTPQGEMNVGDTMVEKLTAAAEGEDSAIAWTVLESQEQLDAALENNEYYGALVIPADYTKAQVAKQMAAAAEAAATGSAGATAAAATATEETSALTFYLDNAKSPLIAQQMKSNVVAMFEQMGATVDVQIIHQGAQASSDNSTSSSPLSSMLGLQIGIMPLCMAAFICAVLVGVVLFPLNKVAKKDRWKTLGQQTLVVAASTLVAAICAYFLMGWAASLEPAAGPSILFFWMASLCVALILLGAFNLWRPLGVIAFICMFALGMATGTLPPEALPAFWHDWVLPWAPQNYIGQGLRAILFMDAGAWNVGSTPLAIIGVTGACLMVASAFLPASKKTAPAE